MMEMATRFYVRECSRGIVLRFLLTDIESKGDSSRENQCTNQIDEHDKLHAEAECTAKIPYQNKLHKVVDGTVDPSTALGQQNRELLGNGCLAHGLRHEDLLALREGPKHKS